MQQCKVIHFVSCFDPNEWCKKTIVFLAGLNSGHEQSILAMCHEFPQQNILRILNYPKRAAKLRYEERMLRKVKTVEMR
jgi:hypothetical protein